MATLDQWGTQIEKVEKSKEYTEKFYANGWKRLREAYHPYSPRWACLLQMRTKIQKVRRMFVMK